MNEKIKPYLIIKIILGVLILIADFVVGVRLLSGGYLLWGLLTLGCILTGVLVSLLVVCLGRCSTGDSMSCSKFTILTLKVHAELTGAFFHSGPQIVVQLAVFWSGIYSHDLQVYTEPGTSSWMFAWAEILSPALNFISLVYTGVMYCQEPSPVCKQLWSHLSIITTCLLRVFLFSILFKLSPLISCSILFLIYSIAALLYRWFGDGLQSLSQAYFTLYLPCGHTNLQGGKPGYIPSSSGVVELERTRINQEGLLLRVQKYTGVQIFTTLSLIIPYIVLIEIWLLDAEQSYQVADILQSRLFLYLTPGCLLLVSTLSTTIFYIYATKARNAARTWKGLNLGTTLLPPSSLGTDSALPNSTSLDTSRPSTQMSENSAPLSLNSVSQPGTPGQPLNTWGQRPLSEYEDREVHLIPASNRPQSAVYPCLPTAPDLGSQGFNRPKPVQPGNRKCGNDECVACAWMIEGPHFSSTVTNKQYRFMPTVTCTDTSLIYLVTCRRCRKQYVGKTQQSLRERHYGHRREIDTQSSPLGKHFAETCGIDSWRIQIIDQCPTSELNRREGHWIKELSSLSPVGLNIRDETRGNKNIH